jgi:hypothetical protein
VVEKYRKRIVKKSPIPKASNPITTWVSVISTPGLVGANTIAAQFAINEGAIISNTVTNMVSVPMAIIVP